MEGSVRLTRGSEQVKWPNSCSDDDDDGDDHSLVSGMAAWTEGRNHSTTSRGVYLMC